MKNLKNALAIMAVMLFVSSMNAQTNLTFTVNGVSFEMVYVENGSFTMGATSEQGSAARNNEKPAHRVTLSDYYIGKYEVTFEQFAAFIDATGYKTDADKCGGYIWDGSSLSCVLKEGVTWLCDVNGTPRGVRESEHPVINVSWNDAVAYCRWLSQKTGKTFTLPTEAQWEYAARGGDKSKGYMYSGSDDIDAVAWTANEFENNEDIPFSTHLVGTKSPNELELYDMTGNVCEWCKDWYGDYSSGSQTDPRGPSSGSYRVFRGGGWTAEPEYCRISCRFGTNADARCINAGFRVVLLP